MTDENGPINPAQDKRLPTLFCRKIIYGSQSFYCHYLLRQSWEITIGGSVKRVTQATQYDLVRKMALTKSHSTDYIVSSLSAI